FASCEARCASSCTAFQLRSASSDPVASQLPPTHGTHASFRYAGAVVALTPPVGQNATSGNTAESAATAAGPPPGPAGKNFAALRPRRTRCATSLAVCAPGKYGSFRLRVTSCTASAMPGDTMNSAPALAACSACSDVHSV